MKVNCFEYIKGVNDDEYIKLLEDLVQSQKNNNCRAIKTINELQQENKQLKERINKSIQCIENNIVGCDIDGEFNLKFDGDFSDIELILEGIFDE